ncbi:4379_t:CDS:2 [Cetraspora pellucida]|uniref:4379_t:CDS:1 n=1 Tax=Cetraspora pellucida TaxID=1433469 RepID=A0A9N8ZZ51_9GLOM|nr:4379_t:CDS:2 [Cetraspora pellucida]
MPFPKFFAHHVVISSKFTCQTIKKSKSHYPFLLISKSFYSTNNNLNSNIPEFNSRINSNSIAEKKIPKYINNKPNLRNARPPKFKKPEFLKDPSPSRRSLSNEITNINIEVKRNKKIPFSQQTPQERIKRSRRYEKNKIIYKDYRTVNFELLEDFPKWLKGLKYQKYAPCFEGLHWREIIELDELGLLYRGVYRLVVRRNLLMEFMFIKQTLMDKTFKSASALTITSKLSLLQNNNLSTPILNSLTFGKNIEQNSFLLLSPKQELNQNYENKDDNVKDEEMFTNIILAIKNNQDQLKNK